MAVIATGRESQNVWRVGRWIQRALFELILDAIGEDRELAEVIEQAYALDALNLYLKEPQVLDRLIPVLLEVIQDVLAGRKELSGDKRFELPAVQQEVTEALEDLRSKIVEFGARRKAGGTG